MQNGVNVNINDESKKRITEIILNAVTALDGFEMVDTKFYKEYGSLNVTVLIWRKEGVDLDACERAHNAVSVALDTVEDCFPEKYVLNVSSMGLDRPISSSDDFRRALDTEIEVFEGKNKSRGVLKEFDDERIILINETKKEKIIFRLNITKVQPYIGF